MKLNENEIDMHQMQQTVQRLYAREVHQKNLRFVVKRDIDNDHKHLSEQRKK